MMTHVTAQCGIQASSLTSPLTTQKQMSTTVSDIMAEEGEWSSTLKLTQSPRALSRTTSRIPLSPLERNISRTVVHKDDTKLRAVKSLDLEAFRTKYPRESPQKHKSAPKQLRSCRSMALRPAPTLDAIRGSNTPLERFEDVSSLEEDHFTAFECSAPLDGTVEPSIADIIDETVEGHMDETEEDEPESESATSAYSPRDLTKPSDLPLETPPSCIQLPQNPFSRPSLPETNRVSLGHSPTKRDSFDSDVDRPSSSSRHRRTLSRIAAIGEVPTLTKTPDHTPLNSPKVDQMCIFTAADARTCDILQPAQGLDSLQNILSTLAQKERRVLEAEHALRDARADLRIFRERLNAMMDPSQAPLATLCGRPKIIARSHQPNVGINGLHYSHYTSSTRSSASMSVNRKGLASKFVHSLLDLVHCIISVFPTHVHRVKLCHEYTWYPEYPSPVRFLYGMEL